MSKKLTSAPPLMAHCVQSSKDDIGGTIHVIKPKNLDSPLYRMDYYEEKLDKHIRTNIATFHVHDEGGGGGKVKRMIPCDEECMFAVVKDGGIVEVWSYDDPRGVKEAAAESVEGEEDEDEETEEGGKKEKKKKVKKELPFVRVVRTMSNVRFPSRMKLNKTRMKLNQTRKAVLFYDCQEDFFVLNLEARDEYPIHVDKCPHTDMFWLDDDTVAVIDKQGQDTRRHCMCFLNYVQSDQNLIPFQFPKIENLPDQVHVIGNTCLIFDTTGAIWKLNVNGELEFVMKQMRWEDTHDIVSVIYYSEAGGGGGGGDDDIVENDATKVSEELPSIISLVYKKAPNQYVYKSIAFHKSEGTQASKEINLNFIVNLKKCLHDVTFLQFSRVPLVMDEEGLWYNSTFVYQEENEKDKSKPKKNVIFFAPWVQVEMGDKLDDDHAK